MLNKKLSKNKRYGLEKKWMSIKQRMRSAIQENRMHTDKIVKLQLIQNRSNNQSTMIRWYVVSLAALHSFIERDQSKKVILTSALSIPPPAPPQQALKTRSANLITQCRTRVQSLQFLLSQRLKNKAWAKVLNSSHLTMELTWPTARQTETTCLWRLSMLDLPHV